MRLRYFTLNNFRWQQILLSRDCNLVHIRPHIFRRGVQAGTLKVQVYTEDGFLLKESPEVDINDIGLNIYAHGYVKFDVGMALSQGLKYRIGILAGGGYSFSDSLHVGVVQSNHDLRKVEKSYSGPSEIDLELWERDFMTREIDFFDGFSSSQAPGAGTQASLANNQSSPANIAGMVMDAAVSHRKRYAVTMYRKDDGGEFKREAVIEFQYKPVAGIWTPVVQGIAHYDEVGVTLSVTAGGQGQYTSTNMVGGGPYTGYFIFEEMLSLAPGV